MCEGSLSCYPVLVVSWFQKTARESNPAKSKLFRHGKGWHSRSELLPSVYLQGDMILKETPYHPHHSIPRIELGSDARKLSPSVHCCQRTCPWVTSSRRSWTPIRHLEVEKRLRIYIHGITGYISLTVLDWNWVPSTRLHTAKQKQQDRSFVASFQLI